MVWVLYNKMPACVQGVYCTCNNIFVNMLAELVNVNDHCPFALSGVAITNGRWCCNPTASLRSCPCPQLPSPLRLRWIRITLRSVSTLSKYNAVKIPQLFSCNDKSVNHYVKYSAWFFFVFCAHVEETSYEGTVSTASPLVFGIHCDFVTLFQEENHWLGLFC